MNKEEKEAIEFFEKSFKKKIPPYWYDDTISNIEEKIKTILNLIQKQSKIIDKMAEFLEDELTIDEFCNKENCYADEYINGHCQKCLNCIKEYFKKEVEKDVED